MTETKDKIKQLQQKYNVTASHPSGLQCKCIEGAIGHYNLELEKLIAESNRKFGLELLERFVKKADNYGFNCHLPEDQRFCASCLEELEKLLDEFKSQIEKENGNNSASEIPTNSSD